MTFNLTPTLDPGWSTLELLHNLLILSKNFFPIFPPFFIDWRLVKSEAIPTPNFGFSLDNSPNNFPISLFEPIFVQISGTQIVLGMALSHWLEIAFKFALNYFLVHLEIVKNSELIPWPYFGLSTFDSLDNL